ncbi:hypothetical protein ACOMHN_062030 [Nucella lapillus]
MINPQHTPVKPSVLEAAWKQRTDGADTSMQPPALTASQLHQAEEVVPQNASPHQALNSSDSGPGGQHEKMQSLGGGGGGAVYDILWSRVCASSHTLTLPGLTWCSGQLWAEIVTTHTFCLSEVW